MFSRSKQQALEEKQQNVETELRNLMDKPGEMKEILIWHDMAQGSVQGLVSHCSAV